MEITKENWNKIVQAFGGSFLQSFEWGIFQESLGRKIWRINIEGQSVGLVIKNSLPLQQNYLYCPRGPIFKSSQNLELFLNEVASIAKAEKSVFIKIESTEKIQNEQLIRSKDVQPTKTVILDLSKSEEELLSQMHQKTRYNLRLAQKKGVAVEALDLPSQEQINAFLKLSEQTAQRDKFSLHPQEYYQKMLMVLVRESMVKLFIARMDNKIIAANIVLFFGDTATYLHGSSDYEFRTLMAPYLLQWQAILKAKAMGFEKYDFWGIDENKWPGVTRFKRGFGGQEINYPGAYDFVWQKKWYQLYNLAKKVL